MTNVLACTAQDIPIYHLLHCANVCIAADSGTVRQECYPEHQAAIQDKYTAAETYDQFIAKGTCRYPSAGNCQRYVNNK